MEIETVELAGSTPGIRHTLKVLRYGRAGAGPKAMIQAALHADEIPAMLVAACLREQLAPFDKAGAVLGEIILVPYANPMGLAQQVLGMPLLERFFHYRNVDVSTLKELARRWKPALLTSFKKQQAHTALADIHESIDELLHYRTTLLNV